VSTARHRSATVQAPAAPSNFPVNGGSSPRDMARPGQDNLPSKTQHHVCTNCALDACSTFREMAAQDRRSSLGGIVSNLREACLAMAGLYKFYAPCSDRQSAAAE